MGSGSSAKRSQEATAPAPPERRQVLLSTPRLEPWSAIGSAIQELLEVNGCAVHKLKAPGGEQLERLRRSQGFVLLLHQGEIEKLGPEWLKVPRIAVDFFPSKQFRGGSSKAELYVQDAIAAARKQWEEGISLDLQWVSDTFEALHGALSVDSQGQVQGLARCLYVNGDVYEGAFENGLKHGQGTLRYANGDLFEGAFCQDRRQGHGRFTWSNGDLACLYYEYWYRPKGPGVKLEPLKLVTLGSQCIYMYRVIICYINNTYVYNMLIYVLYIYIS